MWVLLFIVSECIILNVVLYLVGVKIFVVKYMFVLRNFVIFFELGWLNNCFDEFCWVIFLLCIIVKVLVNVNVFFFEWVINIVDICWVLMIWWMLVINLKWICVLILENGLLSNNKLGL